MWRLPLSLMAFFFALITIRQATWEHVAFGATHLDGSIFYNTVYYPYLNGHTAAYTEPTLQGWYWSDDAHTTEWRIYSQGQTHLEINGVTVFESDTPAGEAMSARVKIPLEAGANLFKLVGHNALQQDTDPVIYIQEHHPLLGWQLLERTRIYPNDPTPNDPAKDQKIARQLDWLRGLFILSALGFLFTLRGYIPRLKSRHLFWLAVFMVALLPRLILVLDRYQRDVQFHHLLAGGDNYIWFAYNHLAGNYNIIGSLWGPGNIIWISEWMRLAGPNILWLHLANALAGAIMCVAVADMSCRLFGWRAAKGTALILAFFPQLIFYQTSHLVNSMGSTITGVMLWLMLVYATQSPSLKRDAPMILILGLLIGFAGMFRVNLLIFTLLLPLLLWIHTKSIPSTLARTLPVAIVAFLSISPMTPLNPEFGDTGFIVTSGSQTLHIGNNETADGIYRASVSFRSVQTRGLDRNEAITNAIKDDPLRMVELYLRKIGLIWTGAEDGNLLDINRSGTSVSPFFALFYRDLHFDLLPLAILGLWGVYLIPYRKTDGLAWLIPLGIILFTLATAVVIAMARLRVQLFLFLALSGGYTLAQLTLERHWRRFARPLALAIISLLVLAGFRDYLPRPRFYSAPPENALLQDTHYDEAIRLAAYEPLQTDLLGGGAIAGRLYFERIGEVKEPYTVSVIGILPDGSILQNEDWILGCNGYPCTDPAGWKNGRLMREEFFLGIPKTVESPISSIRIGVILYTVADQRRAIVSGNATEWGDQVGLVAGLGITPLVESPPDKPEWILGDMFQLLDYQVSADSLGAGETLSLDLDWMARRPADESYGIYIHLIEDDMQTLHGQVDGNPTHLGIEYPTLQWGVGQLIADHYELMVNPDTPPGIYNLKIGFYSRTRPLRLPVSSEDGTATDGIILQKIEIK